MNGRRIFEISVVVIAILCLNVAIYLKITEKEPRTKDERENVVVDTVALTENFENIFDNSIDYQNNNNITVDKKDTTKDLVYTEYSKVEKIDGKYDISANVPQININEENIIKINKEIEDLFTTKVNNILLNAQTAENNIIYSVKYKAYLNDNILSLVISSYLTEGTNSQRLIIKTYNYNISSKQVLDINQLLNYRALNIKEVQRQINDTIKSAAETSAAYQELGFSKYLRNVNDEMYKVENTKVFFLGSGKSLYVIYPYGNSNYTTEMDLIVI